MKRSILLMVVSLAALSGSAEELYVPINGDGGITLVNSDARPAAVTIELLESAGGAPEKTTPLTLAAGERVQWSEHAFGVIRVTTNDRVTIDGAAPVLAPSGAFAEGSLDAKVSAIGVVNPSDREARVDLQLMRGNDRVDSVAVLVPARGTRFIRMDRLFADFARGDRVAFGSPSRVLLFGYDDARHAFATASVIPIRRRAVRFPSAVVQPAPPTAQTVVLTPSKDATLYESSDGASANGSGVHFIAGRTGSGATRRALIAFDVASKVPAGSTITRVTLTLRLSRTISSSEPMKLHRVSADWGEGASDPGFSRDGFGAEAKAGDSTWIHTFFPDKRWSNAGGDFAATPDGATDAASAGNVIWPSSAALIARVQSWADQPSANFGWILIGDETRTPSSKEFDSREVTPETTRPSLTIEFTR